MRSGSLHRRTQPSAPALQHSEASRPTATASTGPLGGATGGGEGGVELRHCTVWTHGLPVWTERLPVQPSTAQCLPVWTERLPVQPSMDTVPPSTAQYSSVWAQSLPVWTDGLPVPPSTAQYGPSASQYGHIASQCLPVQPSMGTMPPSAPPHSLPPPPGHQHGGNSRESIVRPRLSRPSRRRTSQPMGEREGGAGRALSSAHRALSPPPTAPTANGTAGGVATSSAPSRLVPQDHAPSSDTNQ